MPKPLTKLLNLSRKYSVWAYQWGLACCAIEMGAALAAPRYDVMRLGVIPFPASPRQADLVIISGTVTDKIVPAIRRLYEQMPDPKYVISMGSCTNCGGPVLGQLLGHEGRRPDRARSTSTSRAARPGPRPCSRASCCSRSASRTRTWPRAGGARTAGSRSPLADDTATDDAPAPAEAEAEAPEVATDDRARGPAGRVRRAPRRRRRRAPHPARPGPLDPRRQRGVGHRRRGGAGTQPAAGGSTSSRPSTGCPSPYGRYEDSYLDTPFPPPMPERSAAVARLAGGDTRIQVLASVARPGTDLRRVPQGRRATTSSPASPRWTHTFAGAAWHEREAWEMFGIDFEGNPDLRHIYLPTEFEGHPLRKEFPLLARVVKPWPGIVDVEPMPGGDDEDDEEAAAAGEEGEADDCCPHRSAAAGLRQRAGRRRARQHRARDRRRHGPQHGPAAPRHPRHAAHHRPPRRRAGHLGRRHVRLHAPRLREALRGPHLPAGHHAGEPHRLARQLRQRGAVHPRRRAADGASRRRPGPRGSARSSSSCPASPTSASSSATSPCSSAPRRRPSSPSATASSCSTRSSRSRAAASTRTSTASAA